MKKLFGNLKYKLQGFMLGRYGFDELSHFFSIIGLIIMLIACFVQKLGILYFFGIAFIIFSWYRGMSKNCSKRRQERDKYLAIREKSKQKRNLIKNMWRNRKTHRYYKCPNCKAIIRVPKPGKHKSISITCPRCNSKFSKKT